MTQEQAVSEIRKQAEKTGAKFLSQHETKNWGPAFGPAGTKTIYLTYEVVNPKNSTDVRRVVFSACHDGHIKRS